MEKNRIPLLDGWKFGLTGDKQAVRRDYDDSAWRTVDVPHDWQIEQPRREDAIDRQGFFPREHIGVYRLHFTPDPAWNKAQMTDYIHEVVDTYGKGGGLVSNFMHSDPEMLWDGTMELYYYSREKYEETSV